MRGASRLARPAVAAAATALLVLCVNWAPAALGSNRLLPWAINAIAAGCALLLAAAHAHLAGRSTAERLAPAALPLLLAIAVMTWIAVQALAPAPAAFAHPAWGEAGLPADVAGTARVSVNPRETLLGLTRLATAAAVCVAALMLARNPARARLLVDAFVAAAVLYALYGLLRLALAPDKVLWFDVKPRSYLTGPFLSRNQAATYFGLASLAALAMLIEEFRRLARPLAASRLRVQIAGVLAVLPWRLGARLGAFLLLACALLLTGSRAGIAATAAAMTVLAVLTALRQRRRSGGPAPLMLLGGALVAVLAAAFEIAGGRIADRLLADGLAPGARLDVYRTTLAAVADHAWRGSGYGTFQDVFPAYRTDAGPAYFTWDKAHNDYLELMLGLGLPTAGLVLFALAAATLTAARGALKRRRHAAFPAMATAATALVAVHALVDFSLQIQAITLAYAMMLAIGLAQAVGRRRAVAAPLRREPLAAESTGLSGG